MSSVKWSLITWDVMTNVIRNNMRAIVFMIFLPTLRLVSIHKQQWDRLTAFCVYSRFFKQVAFWPLAWPAPEQLSFDSVIFVFLHVGLDRLQSEIELWQRNFRLLTCRAWPGPAPVGPAPVGNIDFSISWSQRDAEAVLKVRFDISISRGPKKIFIKWKYLIFLY